MIDYTQIDTNNLDLEDALSDDGFNKSPQDYFKFLAINVPVLEGFVNFMTNDEIAETIRAVSDYCVNGHIPDYSQMHSTASRMTVSTLINDHNERLNGEYVRHYKQYVSTQKKKQSKS